MTTGALIIFTQLNLYIALAHAFFVSCLFGVLSYLLLLAVRSKRNEQQLAQLKGKIQTIPSMIVK
jgi:cytochrome c oxidase assembly protein subunit 15